jgi:hypothetical protein
MWKPSCVKACTCACMHVCVCVCTYTHTHTYTHIHTHTSVSADLLDLLGSAGEEKDNGGADGEVGDRAQSPYNKRNQRDWNALGEHTKFFVFEVLTVQDGYNGGRFRD